MKILANSLRRILLMMFIGGLGWASPSFGATSWYFSDTAPCGANNGQSPSTPFCLDENRDGYNEVFSYLTDGAGPEVVAGDTINLCAGNCDGTGSTTYRVGCWRSGGACAVNHDNLRYWFKPDVSGISGSPITVRPYCAGVSPSCETVTMSGDRDGDAVFDSDEPHNLFTDNNFSHDWWVVDGDPANLGTAENPRRFLIFERSGEEMFHLEASPDNWTFDSIVSREVGATIWGGGDARTKGCLGGGADYAMKIGNLNGSFTVKNSYFYDQCKIVFRIINNPNATQILIENNTLVNMAAGGADTLINRNLIFRKNYIEDFGIQCISIEENSNYITIEDNTCACTGVHVVTTDGRCGYGIRVDDGTNDPPGNTHDVTIRGNKVFGTNWGVFGTSLPPQRKGWLSQGIAFVASCLETRGCTNINTLIENNMIWYIQTGFSPDQGDAALVVSGSKPITVQNNSIYYSQFPLTIGGTGAHRVRNNLVVKGFSDKANSNTPELCKASSNAIFENNNFSDAGNGGTVVCDGSSSNCSTCARAITCSSVSTFGSGNLCGAAGYVNTSGAKDTWDLHLTAASTLNLNAGTDGAQDDIDGDDRTLSFPVDIGADEYGLGGTTPPAARVTVAGATSWSGGGSGGVYLREGTWTVTLTSTRNLTGIPTPFTFTDSSGGVTSIVLTGSVPGTVFTGSLAIGAGTSEGQGSFALGTGALVDQGGITGNAITTGSSALVDRTPPAAPSGPVVQ